jgi:hypothetical protein
LIQTVTTITIISFSGFVHVDQYNIITSILFLEEGMQLFSLASMVFLSVALTLRGQRAVHAFSTSSKAPKRGSSLFAKGELHGW